MAFHESMLRGELIEHAGGGVAPLDIGGLDGTGSSAHVHSLDLLKEEIPMSV